MEHSFDLATFKKAQRDMIAKNENYSYFPHQSAHRLREYSLEEIETIINGSSLAAQRKLSRTFYEKDGLYKRIILHYATILLYYGILTPNPGLGKKLSATHIQKRYFAAMEYISTLNLPDILTRISTKALIDGAYFGVLQTLTKENFVLIDLPSAYCDSRFVDVFGNEIVEFDVSYFDSIIDETVREQTLKVYPKEISSHYKKYKKGKVLNWMVVPSDIGVYFSFYGDGRPLFLSAIPAILLYDDTVDTERDKALEEIKKIIVQKIPHLTDGTLLFEPEEATVIHEGTVGMMKKNKNVSVLTTYADVESIVSKTSSDTVSSVLTEMLQNVYSETGVTGQIFAPAGTQSLPASLKNDIALMMILGNKYSNFLTQILNNLFANSNINFTYTILPLSIHNQDEYLDNAFKLTQSGYSLILPSVIMGINQRSLNSLKELENDVLKLGEKLIPPSSAYTQSANSDEVGAPKKSLEEKAPKTIQNEDSLNRQGGSNE